MFALVSILGTYERDLRQYYTWLNAYDNRAYKIHRVNVIDYRKVLEKRRAKQRKGRIQRIGQLNANVYIYNMRYKGSVEDRVHYLLSERLESIYSMFGQLPDVLEDV
jgi:hypothetical protein